MGVLFLVDLHVCYSRRRASDAQGTTPHFMFFKVTTIKQLYWVHRPTIWRKSGTQCMRRFQMGSKRLFSSPSLFSIICSVRTIPPRACASKAPQSILLKLRPSPLKCDIILIEKRTIYRIRINIGFCAKCRVGRWSLGRLGTFIYPVLPVKTCYFVQHNLHIHIISW